MFERLTIKTDICIEPENEIVYHNPNDPEGMYNILDLAECLYSGGEAEAGILMEISRRLAAYEDSQMTPEEVQSLAQAKADGRLVVLPCKVGDTVYAVYGYLNKSIGTAIVKQICVRDNEIRVVLNNSIEKIWGRSVFATQEEAEKALGGAEDGK